MTLPSIKDDIMLREADEGTFVINLDDGEMYQLNPSALKIFKFCKEGMSIDDAVSQLAAECSEAGQEAVIREDIEQTTGLFRELGFLSEE